MTKIRFSFFSDFIAFFFPSAEILLPTKYQPRFLFGWSGILPSKKKGCSPLQVWAGYMVGSLCLESDWLLEEEEESLLGRFEKAENADKSFPSGKTLNWCRRCDSTKPTIHSEDYIMKLRRGQKESQMSLGSISNSLTHSLCRVFNKVWIKWRRKPAVLSTISLQDPTSASSCSYVHLKWLIVDQWEVTLLPHTSWGFPRLRKDSFRLNQVNKALRGQYGLPIPHPTCPI